MKLKVMALSTVAICGFLFLSACNSTTLTITLDAVTIAADAALSVVETNGSLAPGQETQVASVIADVTNATQLASTELAGNDPATLKAANVTAFYMPVLLEIGKLSGLPPAIQLSLTAVSVSIQAVLKLIPTPPVTAKFEAATHGKPLLSNKDAAKVYGHAFSVGVKARIFSEKVNAK